MRKRKGRDRILTRREKGRRVREIIRGNGRGKKKTNQSMISEQTDPDVHLLSPHCICGSESFLLWVLPALSVSSQYGSQKGGLR